MYIICTPRFFFLYLPPSVHPSVRYAIYLLLNHWTKFNQICCVSYSHEWGVQQQFFAPVPWGPGEGSNGQISFNFNYKANFKDFKYQTLCVFSKMKDTNYIRQGFLFHHLGHALGVGLGVLRAKTSNSVPLSARYAFSSLTIGRNSTKFGV